MNKTLDLIILNPFLKWLSTPTRYKIAYGGRGSGKSLSVESMAVFKSYQMRDKVILFARESQKSLMHSSMPSIKNLIIDKQIDSHFDMTASYIRNKETNVLFMFIGLRECSIDSIKSIANVELCIIDEAQAISDYSLEILKPSIRAKDSQIWLVFNPRYESDPVYKMVKEKLGSEKNYTYKGKTYTYEEYQDETYLITKANYDSNCLFPDVLEAERYLNLIEKPESYGHTWLGQIRTSQGRIFNADKLQFYNYEQYTKQFADTLLVKALIDPAFGKDNCFTSCIIYTTIHNHHYILDAGLMRNSDSLTTDEILTQFLYANKVKRVLVESNFAQKELAKILARSFDVVRFNVRTEKLARISDAQYAIRETVLFDSECLKMPTLTSDKALCESREGRNYIGMRQLLDFSDKKEDNNIKGNDFSYLDFPDALASICHYDKIEVAELPDMEQPFDPFDNEYATDDEFRI